MIYTNGERDLETEMFLEAFMEIKETLSKEIKDYSDDKEEKILLFCESFYALYIHKIKYKLTEYPIEFIIKHFKDNAMHILSSYGVDDIAIEQGPVWHEHDGQREYIDNVGLVGIVKRLPGSIITVSLFKEPSYRYESGRCITKPELGDGIVIQRI